MKPMNNEELLFAINECRQQIEEMQRSLEKKKETVDYNTLRSTMTRLNHLKMEARKRNLSEAI